MNREELVSAAKKKASRDARHRRDPRYCRALGVFSKAGLLRNNSDIPPLEGPVALEDVLWAGKVEPRLLELLPAVIIKRPALIESGHLPKDLDSVVRALRQNEIPEAFRGVSGVSIAKWLPHIGHRSKLPTTLKTFRFRKEDVALLRLLAERESLSETDVVRAGLRALLRRPPDGKPESK